jgi:hypothetical protein
MLSWIMRALEGGTPCTYMGNDMTYEDRQREIARRKREEERAARVNQSSSREAKP